MLRCSKKKAPNYNFGTVRKLTKCTFDCKGIVHSSDFYSHKYSLQFSFHFILIGHLLDLCEFWSESRFSYYAITSKENIYVSNCCGQSDFL